MKPAATEAHVAANTSGGAQVELAAGFCSVVVIQFGRASLEGVTRSTIRRRRSGGGLGLGLG